MKQDFVDHHLIFDTAVRRIGGDLDGTSTLRTGFYRAAFGSMSPKAPTFGEHPFQASPQGAYFWWAQVIAMDGMYAGFAGAKTGHGPALFFWSFAFFLQTFPAPGGRDQGSMLTVWMVRHSDKYTVEPCQIDSRFRYQ